MSKINIAVIYGGANTEHEVSRSSAATIISALSPEKYNVIPIFISQSGRWILNDGPQNEHNSANLEKFGQTAIISPSRDGRCVLRIASGKAREISIDAVFPVLHGRFGEDGTIQGLCELAGLPYVGSGVLGSALSMDKYYAKMIAASLGINHAPYLTFKAHNLTSPAELDEAAKSVRYKLGYPCFVKPSNSGSSVGISKVRGKAQLLKAIETALQHDHKILVEKAVSGRELECSVIGGSDGDVFASEVGEIVSGEEFYTYDAKYNNKGSQTIAPADIPAHVSDQIKNMSVKIFEGVDAYGLARVDFFWDEAADAVYFSEINTMPGFTNISMYPMLLNASGMTTPQIVDKLVDLAFKRDKIKQS
ncbi:MAG: D-alanine--D-alanine ligase [Defluviitaleaceae bacterium]|nr:D-alanine--D-alanine ligase [Defluviitaleaceae bacterium]